MASPSALDALGRLAQSALAWAGAQPTGVLLAAGAGVVALVAVGVGARSLGGRRATVAAAVAAPAEDADPAEARILVLKLLGDADHAVGVRLAALLTRRFEGVAGVAHSGGSPIKPGCGLDDETRQARAVARRARVGLAVWGAVEGGVLRLRLLKPDADDAAPEALSLPAHLRPPFDDAAAACVAAAGAETDALAGLRRPLAHAADALAAALGSEPPEDPLDAARLRAALARACLALDLVESDRGRLGAALAASAHADERGASEPLEWAEARAMREQALARRHVLAEPPLGELRERVDAGRAALAVWTGAPAGGRVARAEITLAQALIELADRDGGLRAAAEAERLMEAALARGPAHGDASSRTVAATALLAAARVRLGEREPRTGRLEAAERDLRRALMLAESAGERTRAAAIKDDLARAVARLGERDRGAERLRAAAGLYRRCVAEDCRNDLTRARARAALGRTLVHVGERDRDAVAVDEAVAALRTASKCLTDFGAAAAASQARRALERAERLYAELRAAGGAAEAGR
jgi:hypothetical protein